MKGKHHQILLVALLTIAASSPSMCEIRNFYERDIQAARMSKAALERLIAENNISNKQKKIIQQRLDQHNDFINAHEITERLIKQLRTISPSIFNEIDTISDNSGRRVNVYIKCIRPYSSAIRAAGLTFISQSENDEHQYLSAMGENSVIVHIWIVDHSVFVLAHELGHVQYQVKNLAKYMRFYKDIYREFDQGTAIGHYPLDKSGKASISMEKRFARDYAIFLQNGSRIEKLSTIYYAMLKSKKGG